MAHFDLPTAIALLGKTVEVELTWEEDPQPLLCRTRIVGLVIGVPGVYEHPHFLTVDIDEPSRYPEELFWSQIRRLRMAGE